MEKQTLRIVFILALSFGLRAEATVAQKLELVVQTGQHNILAIALSPDGRTLASGDGNGNIKLSDVASGRELRTLVGKRNLVNSLAFSPDGKTVATGCADKTVKLWDAATGAVLKTLGTGTAAVGAVGFSPDG